MKLGWKRCAGALMMAAGLCSCVPFVSFSEGESEAITLRSPTAGGRKRQTAAQRCDKQSGKLEKQVRRLTQKQYENSVRAVLGDVFQDDDFADFGDGLPTIGMSNDTEGLLVTEVNFEKLFNASQTLVAKALASNSQVRSCARAASDDCLRELIRSLGRQFYRRPLNSSEIQTLQQQLGEVQSENAQRDKVKLLLSSFLVSPEFLFRTEVGEGGGAELSHYEVASVLSYSLWNHPPDGSLYQLAEQGKLKEQKVLRDQVRRMTEDERFKRSMVNFYSDFLKLGKVLTKSKHESYQLNTSMRQNLLDSAHRTLDERVVADAHFMAPFQGQRFYVNKITAPFFNEDPAEYSHQWVARELATQERRGVMSHPAFLISHSDTKGSGIVKRGVFVLMQLLCHDIPDPPDELTEVPLPPEVIPEETSSRELLQLTHSGQAACISCHRIIDPAGFGMENYDGLGRFRTTEKGGIPIEAWGDLRGVGDSVIEFENSVDFNRALAASSQMRNCVLTRFYEYATGIQAEGNSCAVKSFQNYVEGRGGRIQSMAEGLVGLPRLIERPEN